jgi:hypothetical protein
VVPESQHSVQPWPVFEVTALQLTEHQPVEFLGRQARSCFDGACSQLASHAERRRNPRVRDERELGSALNAVIRSSPAPATRSRSETPKYGGMERLWEFVTRRTGASSASSVPS